MKYLNSDQLYRRDGNSELSQLSSACGVMTISIISIFCVTPGTFSRHGPAVCGETRDRSPPFKPDNGNLDWIITCSSGLCQPGPLQILAAPSRYSVDIHFSNHAGVGSDSIWASLRRLLQFLAALRWLWVIAASAPHYAQAAAGVTR